MNSYLLYCAVDSEFGDSKFFIPFLLKVRSLASRQSQIGVSHLVEIDSFKCGVKEITIKNVTNRFTSS